MPADGVTRNTQGYTIQGIPGADSLMFFQVHEPSMTRGVRHGQVLRRERAAGPGRRAAGSRRATAPSRSATSCRWTATRSSHWFNKVEPLTGEALDAREGGSDAHALERGRPRLHVACSRRRSPRRCSGGTGNAQQAGRNEKTVELTFTKATQRVRLEPGAARREMQTEIAFTLPRGYMDPRGVLHREGRMRLATARDEIEPLREVEVGRTRPTSRSCCSPGRSRGSATSRRSRRSWSRACSQRTSTTSSGSTSASTAMATPSGW